MVKNILLFLIFIGCHISQAQTITGHITDAESHASLSGVTVYIGNSSRSTTSDHNGNFKIEGFTNSTYNLIFSMVGYELLGLPSEKIKNSPLEIILHTKGNALDPVIVQNYEKDGWSKWGKLFLDNFIGTLPFSNLCVIKNQNDIKFRHSRSKNTVEAIALNPLLIENKYLGYSIRYDLVRFVYDLNSRYIYFAGYPVFKDLTIEKQEHYKRTRIKRREDVYEGSMMHFMRSLYSNMLASEGFQMRWLQQVPNLERQRVDSIYIRNKYRKISVAGFPEYGDSVAFKYSRDSVQYFQKVLSQPKVVEVLHPQLLTSNALYIKRDSAKGVVLGFDDKLLITYPSKREIPEYYYNKIGMHGDSCITAAISLTEYSQFILYPNGQYAPPDNVFSEKYWAWSEKISTMLPFDYQRPEYENK